MSWTRLCVRYSTDPIRCLLFASQGNDTTSNFTASIDNVDKLIFYGSIESQDGTSKFCYSYKKGKDEKLYMDFQKVNTCAPPSDTPQIIPEGGYGGITYLYTEKPSEQLNLTEYIYRYAKDPKTGITRSMISRAGNAGWVTGEWSGGGTFWAYDYDKSDDNQFIICGRDCIDMKNTPNPLFQLTHGYCYKKGDKALSDFSNFWSRSEFEYNCDGSLIHQEKVVNNANANADGEDNYFLQYDVDPGSRIYDYTTPNDSGYPNTDVIPIINIFKNVSGGADDVYGLFKKLTLNDKFMFCKRPKSEASNGIINDSYSVKYMSYWAGETLTKIKNKYVDMNSPACDDTMGKYCDINWGKSGSDCFDWCKGFETSGGRCEKIITKFCLAENNVNLPICQDTINEIIRKNPDRRPKLLVDMRNKWIDINKNRLLDADFLKFCKNDDTSVASVSNIDVTIKNRCDTLYKDYCKSKAASLDPKITKLCSCINGKVIADTLIPQCHDMVCMNDGYKTLDMINYKNCPKCVNLQVIKNVATDAQISNIKQDLICNVTETEIKSSDTSETTTTTKTDETKPEDEQNKNVGETEKTTETDTTETDTSDDSTNDESEEEPKEDNTMIYIFIAVFVILCIIFVMVMFSGGKKNMHRSDRGSHNHRRRRR